MCWKPAFCVHRVWRNSSFYQEVQRSLCDYRDDFREQRACIKFCFKLGKTARECYEMLKTAFGEQAMGRSQTFQWFFRFNAGRTSTHDDERSGRPVSSSTPEMIEIARQIIREDRRRTIDEVSSTLVGISHGTCHKILTKDLKMRRVASSNLLLKCPDSWASTKNSDDLTFAWTSKKMPLTPPAFFRMSLRVTKPGFTPTTWKPKLNPGNWKVWGHLDRRRQCKWEATSS